MASLVGSEMCIRGKYKEILRRQKRSALRMHRLLGQGCSCLLNTPAVPAEGLGVDLVGRRSIKKKIRSPLSILPSTLTL